ncbi:hypothetical protein DWX56_01845 [Parabacteroides merdae]|uniref:Transmembrane protein n=3 Tax=Bacteroidaceae TaxID=815 RepID=A6KYB3_PHOV8|nr:hypothetical protein BVU_0721 [Phocaeicola vulgatus ATCC 8482]EDO53985.1 hypothetical protein BACUNI_02606 [Bacteroides uniformis ATCC 8492]KAB3839273.1 hypothetical protein GAS47_18855 [Phocaeicola vulgatus]QCY55139.1 hypothetical protein FE931_02740 [Parabacteroides distasonis]RGN78715.1 hypothetical protein DXB40_21135 [Bacteroides sp. 4_1_36]RGT04243.1 hypothetical protein DWX56_01845 [Parabacteroides merdae]
MELFRLDNSLQFLVLFLIRLPVCEFVTIGTMFFNEFAKILVFTTSIGYIFIVYFFIWKIVSSKKCDIILKLSSKKCCIYRFSSSKKCIFARDK